MITFIICLAFLLDILVIFIYFLDPLWQGDSSLLKHDIVTCLNLHQSIFDVLILAILRLGMFSYISYWTRNQHGTRCLVFLSTTFECAMVTVFSLQFYLWQGNLSSFVIFRKTPSREIYFCFIVGCSLASSVLQIFCVLRLNKERLGPDDDLVLKGMLHSSETKLHQWLEKWRALSKHFVRHSGSAFDSILRLYAHTTGSMEQLSHLYEQDPDEFVFYIPQMCSFLLLGAFKQSAQLCMILLGKCSMSHVFAHRMVWYLKAFCKPHGAFSSIEQQQGVLALIAEVEARGRDPAIRFAVGGAMKVDDSNDSTSPVTSTSSTNFVDEVESLLPQKDDYQTFHNSMVDQSSKLHTADPFVEEIQFIDELTKISSHLKNVTYEKRNTELQDCLRKLEQQFFPSNALYLPVGNSFHRIRRLHTSESFTFSTKERVPYLLCAEVVDYSSSRRPTRKRGFAGFSYTMKFGTREFRLSLFDKTSEDSKRRSDRHLDEKSTSRSTEESKEEEAKLGFWSESNHVKSPRIPLVLPRQVSSSSSSFPVSSNVLSGFLDSFTKSPPLFEEKHAQHAQQQQQPSVLPSHLRSTIGDFRTTNSTEEGFMKPVHPRIRHNSAGTSSELEKQGNLDLSISIDSPTTTTTTKSTTSTTNTEVPKLGRIDSTDEYLLSQYDEDMQYEIDEAESHYDGMNEDHSTKLKPVVFKERWSEKEDRIRATSEWGHLPGWRLMPVIVKSDDDLRQEQFALQLIRQFYHVFTEAKLPVWLRPYDVLAVSPTAGLVEAIPDTISIDSLKRHDKNYTTLFDFFVRHFGEPTTSSFKKARQNFVNSMAAYSIVCYLLQIKDRHNGNILLDSEGHIIHIDFGFMLSNNPGNMYFENAPFKLTSGFVELMGGPRSASFRRFRSLCVRAFLVARKHRQHISLLVEMMVNGNEDLPCFAGDPQGTVTRLVSRFQPEFNTHTCENFVHELIDASLDNWRTRWYDKYQRWCVGIF